MIPVDPVLMLAFIPAALALNLTPGADMMFCQDRGPRARFWRSSCSLGRFWRLAGFSSTARSGLPRAASGSGWHNPPGSRALGVISSGVFTALALRLALQQRG